VRWIAGNEAHLLAQDSNVSDVFSLQWRQNNLISENSLKRVCQHTIDQLCVDHELDVDNGMGYAITQNSAGACNAGLLA
jgi:hypothetical protein